MPRSVGAVRVAGSGLVASAVLDDAAHRRLDVQRVGVCLRGWAGHWSAPIVSVAHPHIFREHVTHHCSCQPHCPHSARE